MTAGICTEKRKDRLYRYVSCLIERLSHQLKKKKQAEQHNRFARIWTVSNRQKEREKEK